jgi:DNA-binding transcriptional ArsR family regulator
MDGANIERISKALADETRLLIFEAIADNKEINCRKIATLCRVTQATGHPVVALTAQEYWTVHEVLHGALQAARGHGCCA